MASYKSLETDHPFQNTRKLVKLMNVKIFQRPHKSNKKKKRKYLILISQGYTKVKMTLSLKNIFGEATTPPCNYTWITSTEFRMQIVKSYIMFHFQHWRLPKLDNTAAKDKIHRIFNKYNFLDPKLVPHLVYWLLSYTFQQSLMPHNSGLVLK